MDDQSKLSLSAEIKSANDVIKKLETFTKELEKPLNDNILTHLCDGLQTFLGYDVNSKGYDGSGIVYSDLDRLCDAVMGFLFEIINEVNKNENLQKYKDPLTEPLKKIKQAKYNRNNFDSSIREVSQGIKAWVSGVEGRHRKVMEPLNELQGIINGHMSAFMERKPITDQLLNWQGLSVLYLEEAEKSESALENVDENLRTKIAQKIQFVKQVARNFSASVNNDAFINSVSELNTTFVTQRSEVTEHIETQIREVQSTLDEKFEIIDVKIKNMRQEKNKHIQQITRSVELSKSLANGLLGVSDNGFENAYKNQISEMFTVIKKAVERFSENGVTLLTQFDTVRDKVEGLEGNVRHGLQELRDGIDELEDKIDSKIGDEHNLVGGQLLELRTALDNLEKVTGDGGNDEENLETKFNAQITVRLSVLLSGVENAIGKLSQVVDTGILNGNVGTNDKKIAKLIGDIQSKVAFIKTKVGEKAEHRNVANESLQQQWDAIKEIIKDYVDKVKGEQGAGKLVNDEGLKQIIEGIESYVQGLGNAKFVSVLTGWIKVIVEKDDIVKKHIGTYTSEKLNQLEGTTTPQKVQKVNASITHALPNVLEKALSKAASASRLQDAQVSNMISRFEDFARNIESELIVKDDEETVGLALTSVEQHLSSSNTALVPNVNNYYLKLAIKTIFSSISVSAKNLATELQSFLKQSDLHNKLMQIRRNLDNIDDQFNNDGNSHGDKIDTALTAVTSKIKGLHTNVEKALGKISPFTPGSDSAPKDGTALAVDKSIEAVSRMVTTLDQTFKNHVKEHLSEAVKRFNQSAIERIKDAAKEAIAKAVEQFGNRKQGIIVKQIMTKFHESEQALKSAVSAIHAQLQELKQVPITVEHKKSQADAKMQHLKARIQNLQKQISAIDKHVSTSGRSFDIALQALDVTLQEGKDTAKMAITVLKGDLQKRVKDSFDDLEENVQIMFDAQKKAELQAMQTSVLAEIPQIHAIITADFTTGLKGLMNKLKDTFYIHNLQKVSDSSIEIFSNKAKEFFTKFFNDFKTQQDIPPDRLTPLTDALSSLLSTMHQHNHFSSTVSRKLADLQTQLDTLTPANFAEASPLLDVVKAGVQAFHGELAKQYVSRYSGQNYADQLVKEKQLPAGKTTSPPAKPGDETEITEYGRKCAKVFLTSLATLSNDFFTLIRKCTKEWFGKRINTYEEHEFGKWFENQGYVVNYEKDKQHGELQDRIQMNGTKIYDAFLNNNIGASIEIDTLASWKKDMIERDNATNKNPGQINLVDVLQFLYGQTNTYYQVCHLSTSFSKRNPSSIYDMLVWLTGLPHNGVYSKLSATDFGQLFEEPKEEANDDELFVDDTADTLIAYPENITVSKLSTYLQYVCTHAETVLTSILGHGHADGIYAVDFNTNPDGFSYPTAPGACFDMLCDVLNRLYQQLFFVYKQCSNDESCAGWLNCWYGQGVGGSSFNCNSKQCANQICDQRANQKANQIHEQMGDQHPNCGLKSPLQSFLEDGLPGFLPHQFDKPGCKLTCTYSNHRGLPCKTPMGFADISVMASHTQNGAYLKKVLEAFCGSGDAPLTQLCAQLACLLQKPPQTLGDIFAFYYGYLKDWAGDYYGIKNHGQHRQQAFREAVNAAYFGTQYEGLDPKALCSSKSHNDEHTKGDLCSITGCTTGSNKPCGLYVTSIAQQITRYYSTDHKANHLSWIVYITETFYDLLKKLYDECCAKCDKRGSRCYDKRCIETCEIKYVNGEGEPSTPSTDKHHSKDCKSIITCSNTHPTLYKYGFTFGNPWALNGLGKDTAAKRTCKDFCEALKLMLVEKSVLIELRKQIDEFLWRIREKLSFTVLALWLLSFLYLLHIMVIRLDLLHIKSHLHSPSSHRIAAQSLLAAGRVNKLNRVFYLQP